MNANAATENSEMKISFQRSNTRHAKPLFIAMSRFDMENFPVRVRHPRLPPNPAPESSLAAGSRERRGIPQRQGKFTPLTPLQNRLTLRK